MKRKTNEHLSSFRQWLRKTGRYLYRLLFLLVTLFLITFNGRLYTPVPEITAYDDLSAQLTYLRHRLDEGAGGDMQFLFPEGYYFSYVLYGLSWVNVGLPAADSAVRDQALAEARWAYARLDSEAGRAPFPAALDPPYGMFYVAWQNYLLSGILLLQGEQPEAVELARFQAECEQIATALEAGSSPFLASYSGQVWPVDSFPALVSLQAHTVLVDDRYEPLIAEWLAQIEATADPHLGLIPHRTEPFLDRPRATSQTLILRFLFELDPQLARQQYATFREQYVVQRFGWPAVKEFIEEGRSGDIDSGPLPTGVSVSATVVELGTARVLGDEALARPLWQAGEAMGMPLSWGGQKRYALGLLPIGDLFLLWSQSSHPWLQPAAVENSYRFPGWWRWPTHLLSLLIWGLMGWRLVMKKPAA